MGEAMQAKTKAVPEGFHEVNIPTKNKPNNGPYV